MSPRTTAAIASLALVGIAGGAVGVVSSQESDDVAEPGTTCAATGTVIDPGACAAQGVILYALLYNIQGAVQFCKWKAANPGEWKRLGEYLAAPSTSPPPITKTWFGVALRDAIQAYSYAYGVSKPMPPMTAPNACGGKLIAPVTDLRVVREG